MGESVARVIGPKTANGMEDVCSQYRRQCAPCQLGYQHLICGAYDDKYAAGWVDIL